MEGEPQEGDVARNEVHVADELSQADKPKREEEPQEKRATEEVAELLVWPPHQTVEEAVAAASEGNEEDVGERVLAPPPIPESLATEAEEPEGGTTLVPVGATRTAPVCPHTSSDGLGRVVENAEVTTCRT